MAILDLTAEQIRAYRLRAGGLLERLPMSGASLQRAAHAGLQDSWPRAALLSIHARVASTPHDVLDAHELCQVWGPRFNVYVVAEDDAPYFTVGRRPESGAKHDLGQELADRLDALVAGGPIAYRDAGRELGVDPNQLRYAALTGRLRVRWEGAGAPTVWTVPEPDITIAEARSELARRFLNTLGPSTAAGFGKWAGVATRRALTTFDQLRGELTPVGTPTGDAMMLTDTIVMLHGEADVESAGGARVRLLPGGDSYFLRWADERRLQVPDASPREDLWPTRVWPGALLVDGSLAGTWRRSNTTMTVTPWRQFTAEEHDLVQAEAHALPLPGVEEPVAVRWNPPLD